MASAIGWDGTDIGSDSIICPKWPRDIILALACPKSLNLSSLLCLLPRPLLVVLTMTGVIFGKDPPTPTLSADRLLGFCGAGVVVVPCILGVELDPPGMIAGGANNPVAYLVLLFGLSVPLVAVGGVLVVV